jgi:hypothetical protein
MNNLSENPILKRLPLAEVDQISSLSFLSIPVRLFGESGQIDHLIPEQIDHL